MLWCSFGLVGRRDKLLVVDIVIEFLFVLDGMDEFERIIWEIFF